MLYPLKFKPCLKERLWGGSLLAERLGKSAREGQLIGESWEISGIEGELSVVANGMLAGNELEELIEVYMGNLIGDKIYQTFGLQFPLLIKYIDAQQDLSVQVHPDDVLAAERHNCYGKTEMWYVVDCEPEAELTLGFKGDMVRETYWDCVEQKSLATHLNRIPVHPGEAFFIPAGTVHSIGKGILIAEIQQSSDITYRIYDWERRDASGKERELHPELAADAICFTSDVPFRITASPKCNDAVTLKQSSYFTTNVIELDGELERDHMERDSFVIYMMLEGAASLLWDDKTEAVKRGETILVPACLGVIALRGRGKLLEIYIE